jgi:uncharacterized protein (UPF0548 family)
MMSEFTYAEIGATRHDDLPAGYRHLRRRVRIGTGDRAFAAAAHGLMTFAMFRGAGLRPRPDSERAAPGVRVINHLGFIAAPCEVVWVEDGADRTGFAYGTLAGHPESGEEAFLVDRDGAGVWFTVVAFSRPGAWYARLAGPLGHLMQDAITRRYITAMRRIAAV